MLANCLLFTFGIAIPKLPNAWEFGSNLAGASDQTQLPPPGGLQLPGTGSRPQAQESSSGQQGPAGRPIDRPPAPGKSGTHSGNRAFRGPQTVSSAFCTPGQREPWQAGLCYHNPMLAETKTRRRIRSRPPRRTHANPQSSAHLQLPSSCLAGAADPATRRAYGLPGRGRSPQAQERKSGPQEPAERPWDWPQLREYLGPGRETRHPEGCRQPRHREKKPAGL